MLILESEDLVVDITVLAASGLFINLFVRLHLSNIL